MDPRFAGKYQLLRLLAKGGMGEVLLASLRRQAGFAKLVVVKRILPEFAADPNFVQMFVQEARLSAALDHPNIVRVYDFGRAGDSFFLVMESSTATPCSASCRSPWPRPRGSRSKSR